MNFSFGQPANPASGSLGARPAAPAFGAPSAAPVGFGAPSAAPAGFGAPSAAPAGFGAPSAAPAGFGAPSAAPAGFGAPSAAPAGFGAPSAAPSGFGAPSAASAAFGAPTSAPSAFGALTSGPSTFGAPSSAPSAFGAQAAAPSAFGAQTSAPSAFGAPTAAPSAFGAPTSAPSAFGAPTSAPSAFGAPAAAPSAFGAQTAAPSAFGAPTSAPSGFPASAPVSSVGSVGVVAPQAQGSLFAAPTAAVKPATIPATSTPLFNAPQASTGLFGASSVPSTSSSGLFSGLSTSKPAPATQFGTTTATPTLNFGPGSALSSLAPASSAGQSFSLGGSVLPTSVPSIGLGGVDTTTSASGLSNLSGLAGPQTARPEAKSPKETPIPDDIARGVETFRQYVKKQKSFSSEIARCSSKPLLKVQEDTDAMKQVLSSSTAGLQRLRSVGDKLKADTAKALQHTEMAQRTHDTPPGLQYDNTAPLQYFAELVTGFERDIKLFRQEIENAERHVHSRVQLTGITPAELTQAMRRLYDSFVALAGRLHTVHSQVKAQKEQYLSLRKYILNDASDVFDEAARNRVNADVSQGGKGAQQSRSMVGPTPFSALNAQHGFGLLSAGVAASSRQNFPAVCSLGWSVPANTPGATSLPLTPHPDNPQFQLQKPPSGNKRGKR